MSGIHNYYGFVLAVILLNLTPGADSIYILTRSIAQGRQAGFVSALGIMTGLLVHISAVSFGLAQIVAHSPILFAMIQYSGAAYLIYLGIQLWRAPTLTLSGSQTFHTRTLSTLFKQGMITNLLNPKVLLFFMALLPQFVLPENQTPLPFLLLGITFLFISSIWLTTLVCSASFIGKLMRRKQQLANYLNKICGTVFIALAVKIIYPSN